MKTSVIVIGGGIVGVCNALALQQSGHQVILIDRKQPGKETSYGNAGVLSESSIMVLNNPKMLSGLPKLLLGKSLGLRYSLPFVMKNLRIHAWRGRVRVLIAIPFRHTKAREPQASSRRRSLRPGRPSVPVSSFTAKSRPT